MTRKERSCPRCDEPVESDLDACWRCGMDLTPPAPTGTDGTAIASQEHFGLPPRRCFAACAPHSDGFARKATTSFVGAIVAGWHPGWRRFRGGVCGD